MLGASLVLTGMSAFAEPQQNALRPAGIQAEHFLDLWRLTLGVCAVVFAAVLIAFLVALWRAPRSDAATPANLSSLQRPESRVHRKIVWAIGVSIVLLFVLLMADVMNDRKLSQLPLADGIHIELTGHQWWWEARYTDPDVSRSFTTANELHVPVGRPVILTLKSGDVIHTFWVPNLQGKRDLIPGRTATIRFRADRPGVFRGQCAEFCGLEHAMMALNIVAHPSPEYEAWAEAQRQPAPPPNNPQTIRGREVFLSTTCVMCHTVQGTTANGRVGPDLTHFASRLTIGAGTLPNTKGHLAGWIVDPKAIKPGVNMPANPLPPADLQALLAWMETLK
jgi:cytochrome c oxidase subunit 2